MGPRPAARSHAALAVHFLTFAKFVGDLWRQAQAQEPVHADHETLAIIARRTLRSTHLPVLKPRPGLVLPAGLVLNERSLSDQPVPAKTYLAWSPVSGGDTADWLRAMISRVR